MPKRKDLKRLTRSRLQKTGESYTTARSRLLAKRDTPAEPPARDLATLAGVSDETVRARTGRTWEEWVRVLDAVDAARLPHREIADHVDREHGVSGWWAQSVTVGYERIRGLREIGQRREGGYEAHKSKTLAVPVATLYRAFADEPTRRRWLPDVALVVRSAVPERSMRITWPDGTAVDAYFVAKGEAKSQVAIQHRKLASRADVDRLKQDWAERLAALAAALG
jgi:hypothetical protein